MRNLASEAAGVESATAAWQQALNARQQSAMGMIAATKTSLAALELRVQRDAAATDARVSAIEAAGASCPSFSSRECVPYVLEYRIGTDSEAAQQTVPR